jgi:hypothetical protein
MDPKDHIHHWEDEVTKSPGQKLTNSYPSLNDYTQVNKKQFAYKGNPPKPEYLPQMNKHESIRSGASAYYGDHPLTYIAFERLFWDTLVDLGWKALDLDADEKIQQVILTCPDCGLSIGKTQMVNTLTKSKAHKISRPDHIREIIKDHKNSARGCTAPEYDENGDPVADTPVEALVKAILEES